MAEPGDIVYFRCRGSQGSIPVRATVLTIEGDTLVAAVPHLIAGGLPHGAVGGDKGSRCGFLKVPTNAVTTSKPEGWTASTGGTAPSFETALAIWEAMTLEEPLESSEAEQGKGATSSKTLPPGKKGPRTLEMDLKQMGKELWGGLESGSEEEDSGSEEEEDALPSRSVRHLAPGGSSLKPKTKKDKKKEKETHASEQLQQAMMQGLASGSSPSEMMPLLMMNYLLEQQKQGSRRKTRKDREAWDPLDGSSSEEGSERELRADSGMKAVVALNRLHRRVKKSPKMITQEFEKELIEELGVVEGQAWSIKDWLKKQPWGKFKGLYRSAMMDAAAYELVRNGDPQAAGAQLVQNMKAKLQCVLQQGEWASAWQLTGLPDPLSRREWAGTKEEMAIISGYMNSVHKLKKRMKEAKEAGGAGQDEAD